MLMLQHFGTLGQSHCSKPTFSNWLCSLVFTWFYCTGFYVCINLFDTLINEYSHFKNFRQLMIHKPFTQIFPVLLWFLLPNLYRLRPVEGQESVQSRAKSGLALRALLLQMCWFWHQAIKGVTRAIDQGNCGIRQQIGAKITRCRAR